MVKRKTKSKKLKKENAGVFIIFLVLFVAVILIINYTIFDKRILNNKPKSGYNSPCNTKFGGVEVEGLCYDCGASDGICPEDFGTMCKIKDLDCS